MQLKLNISDISTHEDAALKLIEFAKNETVFLFDAPMGSGKTTFIKSLCLYLGVIDTVNSPTYSIVNEYFTNENKKIIHFDLYRLNTVNELYELGFEDYLFSDNYVFIEWPEKAIPFLTSYVHVKIELTNNNRYLYAEIITTS